jgi:hypothetical protein
VPSPALDNTRFSPLLPATTLESELAAEADVSGAVVPSGTFACGPDLRLTPRWRAGSGSPLEAGASPSAAEAAAALLVLFASTATVVVRRGGLLIRSGRSDVTRDVNHTTQ